MLKLCVYIPQTHLESVKTALFAAGAGRQGDYQCCAWQTLGTGQFKPMAGSQPFIGEQDKIEYVPEYRVEMLLDESQKQSVISALREAHPYEEPAFDLIRLEDV